MRGPGWTEDEIAQLRVLWAQDTMTTAEMAQEIGVPSKNAVVSMARRLDLPTKRGASLRKPGATPLPRKPAKPRLRRAVPKPPVKPDWKAPPRPKAAPQAAPKPVGIWDENPILARIKGFGQGVVENDYLPAELGLLAGLLTGGASIPVQMAAGAGAQAVASGAQAIGGAEGAPESPGEFLTDVGIAGASAGIPGAMGPAARAITKGKEALTGWMPQWMSRLARTANVAGAAIHPGPLIADMATSKPVMGAMEAFGDTASQQPITQTVGNVMRGLKPGLDDVPVPPSHADRMAAGADRYAKQKAAGAAQDAAAARASGVDSLMEPTPELRPKWRGSVPPEPPPPIRTPGTGSGNSGSPALEALYGPPTDSARLVPPVSSLMEDTLPAGGLDTVPDLLPHPLPKGTLRSSSGHVEDVDLTDAVSALAQEPAPVAPSLSALQALEEGIPMDPGGFPASWAEFLEPAGSPRTPWTARVKAADRSRYPNSY